MLLSFLYFCAVIAIAERGAEWITPVFTLFMKACVYARGSRSVFTLSDGAVSAVHARRERKERIKRAALCSCYCFALGVLCLSRLMYVTGTRSCGRHETPAESSEVWDAPSKAGQS